MTYPNRPVDYKHKPIRVRIAPESILAEGRVNGGMITAIDPSDLSNNAARLLRQAYVRDDKTSRRPGMVVFSPDGPDLNDVVKLGFLKKKSGTSYTVRFTPYSIYLLGAGGWTSILPAAGTPALAGTDRFQVAVVNDELVFANNGANVLSKINFSTNQYEKLGNAPAYRYIAGLFNRVVGAAVRNTNEIQIGWSADGVITEFDPLVNETAGNTPLIDSPDDYSDFITGLQAFNNQLIVLREKSIWTGIRQPIPTNPFYFSAAIPGIGCDLPNSVQLTTQGIVWADRATRSVYAWNIGGQLERIGMSNNKAIFELIDNPNVVFCGYSKVHNEYTLCIPDPNSLWVHAWTYNFVTKAWSRNEYYELRSINDTEIATGALTIDMLGDTPIDQLQGMIDDLSPNQEVQQARVFGKTGGYLAFEDENSNVDIGEWIDGTPEAPITLELTSKTYQVPAADLFFSRIEITYEARTPTTLRLEYSKDGGDTTTSWKLLKTITVTELNTQKYFSVRKAIRSKRLAWRLQAVGSVDILAYNVKVTRAEETTK